MTDAPAPSPATPKRTAGRNLPAAIGVGGGLIALVVVTYDLARRALQDQGAGAPGAAQPAASAQPAATAQPVRALSQRPG